MARPAALAFQPMLALLAQLAATPGDPVTNAKRAAHVVRQHPDVDLAVFPELFLSGYAFEPLPGAARPADAEELRLVIEVAAEARTAVVIGFAEIVPGGLANSVACIDNDGTVACVYRKMQLFGREREAFLPGRELRVVSLAGRKAAPLICFDIEFPEPARAVALAGADLLVTASANMDPFFVDHEVATRARALENRLPHLYANMVGSAEGLRFVGGSRSVSADGVVLGELAHDQEELLVAAVGDPGTADERVDYLRHLPGPLEVVAG